MAGEFVGLPGLGDALPGVPPLPGFGAAAPAVPAAVSQVHDGVVAGSLEGVASSVDGAGELRAALRVAAGALNAAGVESPRADAELLAGHLLGQDRGRLAVTALMGAPVPEGYGELVAARASRIPLQHLTGGAPFRSLSLAVGPGVFVPRPETELVAQAAIDEARAVLAAGREPLVVDACTGSGAIAAAVATEVPGAVVHAIELHEAAHAYAAKNLAGTGVRLHLGDALTALEELAGTVDVLVSNPPYVPPREHADPEVQLHDPDTALYGGGADGMDFPRALALRAAQLLRPRGLFVMEHDETQEAAVLALFGAEAAAGVWAEAAVLPDLAGRPRFVVARRAA